MGIDVILPKQVADRLAVASNAPATIKYLWSLTACFSNSSYKDYKRFVDCDEMQHLMSRNSSVDDHGERDQDLSSKSGNSKTCKTTTCSMAAVLDDCDQSVMRRSARASFSCDDADGTRVTKLRMVACNPVVQCHSCVCAVQRDVGHGILQSQEGPTRSGMPVRRSHRYEIGESFKTNHYLRRDGWV